MRHVCAFVLGRIQRGPLRLDPLWVKQFFVLKFNVKKTLCQILNTFEYVHLKCTQSGHPLFQIFKYATAFVIFSRKFFLRFGLLLMTVETFCFLKYRKYIGLQYVCS